jgi:nitrite reductase/ring-hydroxylating ferredoxin subunit
MRPQGLPGKCPMETAASPLHLGRLHDMPDGEATALDVMLPGGEESVILLRLGERVNAWLNICPHAGRRLDWAPGKFLVSKGMLICAAHGACFGVDTGECISGPCRGESLRAVPVRVEHGEVMLDV